MHHGLLGAADPPARQITYRTYFDKVYGGWLGKISGLALGVPKEFSEPWPPSNINYFAQVPDHFSDLYSGDDLYFPHACDDRMEPRQDDSPPARSIVVVSPG